MSNLKNIVLDNLIENKDSRKLLYLYNSNSITNNQKNIIRLKLLTDKFLIINAVENNGDLLNNFKYKNSILVLYGVINDYNNKIKTYVDDMINANNFNENDEAFIWFILYKIIHGNIIKFIINEKTTFRSLEDDNIFGVNYICVKFSRVSNLQRLVGFLRVVEFDINIDDYTKSLSNSEPFNINNYTINENYILFKCDTVFDDTSKVIELHKDYNFLIYSEYNITSYDMVRVDVNGNLFKFDDKYYIGAYNKSFRVIKTKNYYNINSLIREENPYIESASRNLNDILPFITGQVPEVSESYNGIIIDGKYIKTNNYINEMNLDHDGVAYIIYELRNLNM